MIESARSIPRSSGRSFSDSTTAPPYAASTWSHTPTRAAMSASRSIGSIAPVPVVPAVAMIAAGTTPRSEICLDQALQVVRAHGEPLIDRDLADGGLTEPEHVRSAIDREVGLRRRVEREGGATSDPIEPD